MYRVRRRGEDLGAFSLEELRRRREAGEFTGAEYVQQQGMRGWQPLDLVLQVGFRTTPPPLPGAPSRGGLNLPLLWIVLVAGIAVATVGISMFAVKSGAFRQALRSINERQTDALQAATKPVKWTDKTKTEVDVRKRGLEFRRRQWLENYQKHGPHTEPWDADAAQMIEAWIRSNYGDGSGSNSPDPVALSDKLAAIGSIKDPVVLMVIYEISGGNGEREAWLDRALLEFAGSDYPAYPMFCATAAKATRQSGDRVLQGEADKTLLKLYDLMLKDGSLTFEDQPEIAEILLNGWGSTFFSRNHQAVVARTGEARNKYAWLYLVLNGEHHIDSAWKARGNGYADSVSPEGWKGFNDHLVLARTALTDAWKMRPDWPVAAARMEKVALGESDITEMRRWFDRAVEAQMDYPEAWSSLRWGLRPRWYGSQDSMLALGVTAINTKRFDTDVPRMFFVSVSEVESEMNLTVGEHIYGRDDVWPHMREMYEGYLRQTESSPNLAAWHAGWRNHYAVVAYFAGQYATAREQLEALDWKPWPDAAQKWSADLSLMPLEVAARTGPQAAAVEKAEIAREKSFSSGDAAKALELYTKLESATNLDARTAEFVRDRIASLTMEKRLESGEWVDFLPTADDDPNWVCAEGRMHRLPDGTLEVEPGGHFIYCRSRLGNDFEARGEFEVVGLPTSDFQVGLVVGVPDIESGTWDSFRITKDGSKESTARFSRAWTANQVIKPVSLNEGKNSFEFQFQAGKVNASVNGKPVFSGATLPAGFNIRPETMVLGLAARHNTSIQSTVRYRKVEVRKSRPFPLQVNGQ
jgi:hypothetical protein